ncbi:unnamed protein product [Chrysoparadoxa australica]
MMLPFSMQCKTCGEYMYRGKKFNSRKEDVVGEDYHSIKKFRFYVKCCMCSQQITFKTDPENADYTLEEGATRNFEQWKEQDQAAAALVRGREEEEKVDNMKALENRTLDSKMEMDVLDALDEIKAVNKRHEHVNTAEILKAHGASGGKAVQETDDELVAKAFKKSAASALAKRLDDSDDDGVKTEGSAANGNANGDGAKPDALLAGLQAEIAKNAAEEGRDVVGAIIVKKRRVEDDGKKKKKKKKKKKAEEEKNGTAAAAGGGALGLLGYGSGDSDN